MQIKKMDGVLFKALVIGGAQNLKNNYAEIDSLNVFPVPDGDTGTNMKMTIDGGINEIYNLHESSIQEVAKKLSRGMLMGARGNSGVILSQLFRGVAKGFDGFEQVDAIRLAKAFASGVEQAYKAVMKPVEGTILTVAREASEKMTAISSSRMTINEFFSEYIDEVKASLNRTPDLLPVLKESGVVDSGGAGYLCIVEGMIKVLEGEEVEVCDCGMEHSRFGVDTTLAKEEESKEFGYCTEFILEIKNELNPADFDERVVLDELMPIGDSIALVKDDNLIKVHIHTLVPGNVLNIGQKYGEFIKLKIENMTVQHHENQEIKHVEVGVCECGSEHLPPVQKPEVRKKYAVVTVASGEGLIKTFKDLGADYVVSGGQSMNPSTEDFIRGYDTLNAEHILVFPNNKNIILAANQSAKIYTESKVHVIESKTIAQGFSALTMLDISGEVDDIIEEMNNVISNVTTGLVTYSIRDTVVEGLKIRKDDYIGICNNKIVASFKRKIDTVKALLKEAVTDEKELITIIYGNDTTLKEVNEFVKYIEKNYSNLEVDVIEGNQEVYSYILAIE